MRLRVICVASLLVVASDARAQGVAFVSSEENNGTDRKFAASILAGL